MSVIIVIIIIVVVVVLLRIERLVVVGIMMVIISDNGISISTSIISTINELNNIRYIFLLVVVLVVS